MTTKKNCREINLVLSEKETRLQVIVYEHAYWKPYFTKGERGEIYNSELQLLK